jgi:hypothetical protein
LIEDICVSALRFAFVQDMHDHTLYELHSVTDKRQMRDDILEEHMTALTT